MGISRFKNFSMCGSDSSSSSDESDDEKGMILHDLSLPGNPIPQHLTEPLPTLCQAIHDGNISSIISLLESRPKLVNGESFHGQPPLHFACYKTRIDLVNTLLQYGAKVDATDNQQNTALYVTTILAWPDGVQVLLKHGAPANQLSVQTGSSTKEKSGQNNVLHSLLQTQRRRYPEPNVVECAQLLIEAGLDVNSCNAMGESIIYCAALADYPLLVEYILQLNVDSSVCTHEGRTVLHAACYSGSHRTLDIFLHCQKMKKLVTFEDKRNETPFHLAVKSNSFKCCHSLLQNGDHLMNEDHRGNFRYELLEDMPSASDLYLKLFNSSISISSDDMHDPNLKVKFDYHILVRQENNVQKSPIFHLMQFENSVLEHPLIEHFLTYKWNCIKPLFYIKMLIYFIFLLVHTWYIIQTYGRFPKKWIESMTALYCFQTTYLILFLSFLIPDLLFMFLNFKRYFKQWETLVKVLTVSTAAFIIFSPRILNNSHIPQIVHKDSADNEIYLPIEYSPLRSDSDDIMLFETDDPNKIIFPDDLGNLKPNGLVLPHIPIAEFEIVFPGDKILNSKPKTKPKRSSYVKDQTIVISSRFGISRVKESDMFENISYFDNVTWRTYVPIETYTAAVSGFLSWAEFMLLMAKVPSLGVYILIFTHVALALGKFLFAFSSLVIGFAVTFHIIFKNMDAFGTIQDSIIKTMIMMIGEIEYGDMLETPTPFLSKIFLIIFLFSVTVLMANLLIGLTIEDIPKLKHEGMYMRLRKQASYLASYENLMNIAYNMKCFPLYIFLNMFRYGKFNIPKTVTVYPNRSNKTKIKKQVLAKAKEIWLENNKCSKSVEEISTNCLKSDFKHFKEQYFLDKQILHKRLDQLMSAITKHSIK